MARSKNVGSDNPMAKLNEKSVSEIRFLFDNGEAISKLADMYGVTKSNIWYVVRIRTWKHVKP